MKHKTINRYILAIIALVMITVSAQSALALSEGYYIKSESIDLFIQENNTGDLVANVSGSFGVKAGSYRFTLTEETTRLLVSFYNNFKSIANGDDAKLNRLLKYFAERVVYYKKIANRNIRECIVYAYVDTLVYFGRTNILGGDDLRDAIDENQNEIDPTIITP